MGDIFVLLLILFALIFVSRFAWFAGRFLALKLFGKP